MDMIYEGKVAWIFPNHFDVDLMIGVQNIRETNLEKLSLIFMSDFEDDFVSKINKGDILIGGRNFGYGHAHPQVMSTLRYIGINIIVADSFAPGFFRGESNNGMVLLSIPGIKEATNRFDIIRINYREGTIENISQNTLINGKKPSDMSIEILKHKGYKGFLKDQLAKLRQKEEN